MEKSRSLICINTCNRFDFFKYIAPSYIEFCSNNSSYDFLVSVDGNNSNYIRFCEKYRIPLLYSDEREGVGMSKNRVLKAYPDYDFYFFLEDDVELMNAKAFDIHLEVFNKTGLHHLSLGNKERFIEFISTETVDPYTIYHTLYGDASFNFFSKEGLAKVGGWHTEFAKHKRFGHTEHSFRFYTTKLCPAPFNVISDLIVGYFIFHDPKSVTKWSPDIIGSYHIAKPEELLIEQKLSYFPVTTLSGFHVNAYAPNMKTMITPKLNAFTKYIIGRRLRANPYLKARILNFIFTYVIFGRFKAFLKRILNK